MRPSILGGFGESASLKSSTSVRLSVQFFRADKPTFSLAAYADAFPPSVILYAVLLGRDSLMLFNSRSYRSLSPRVSEHRVFGELELVHHAPAGASAYAIDPVASEGNLHLCYEGSLGVTMSDEPQLLAVNLLRTNGSPALTGHYLVGLMPQSDLLSVEEYFVTSRRQVFPIVGVGVADLEPGDILGAAHAPLMSVPLDPLQLDYRVPKISCGLSEVSPICDLCRYGFTSRSSSLALACRT